MTAFTSISCNKIAFQLFILLLHMKFGCKQLSGCRYMWHYYIYEYCIMHKAYYARGWHLEYDEVVTYHKVWCDMVTFTLVIWLNESNVILYFSCDDTLWCMFCGSADIMCVLCLVCSWSIFIDWLNGGKVKWLNYWDIKSIWWGWLLSCRFRQAGRWSRFWGSYISETAGGIVFNIQSFMELSTPVVVQHHEHLPFYLIWACPWAKHLSNQVPVGSRLWGTHICEIAGGVFPIQSYVQLTRPVVVQHYGHLPISLIWASHMPKTCQIWYHWLSRTHISETQWMDLLQSKFFGIV